MKVELDNADPCTRMSSGKTLWLPLRQLPVRLLKILVRIYQLTLSPFIGNQCRFYPTCSHYALDALDQHGAFKGGVLTLKRLGRCHPFNEGGFDPVPDHQSLPGRRQAPALGSSAEYPPQASPSRRRIEFHATH